MRCIVLLLVVAMAAPAVAQSAHPDSARIVTEDIGRFWEAFDAASPAFEAAAFQTLYLDPGSAGVIDFTPYRIINAELLAREVRSHNAYYASIRPSTLRILEMEPAIRAGFRALDSLYPDAVFPDVFFVIGALNSGGTASSRGLIIGAEMYGRSEETPLHELNDWLRTVLKPVESVPWVVAHELVHFQQQYPVTTLLERALKEGSADFIAEKIAGRQINESLQAYALPREEALWLEFKERMDGEDFTGWLYGGDENSDRPADLGYWMGYRICQAYYERAVDKGQAIRDIIELQDAKVFLEASGYAGKSKGK